MQEAIQDKKFTRRTLPLGDGDEVSVLVGEEAGQPRTVFMSYEAFCELVGTLYTAVEALRATGAGAEVLDEMDDDLQVTTRPRLRVV